MPLQRAQPPRLHDDEVAVTADVVRRLVAAQLPQLARRPVTPLAEAGTDHRLFRLGDDLVARMPTVAWAAAQAESDARWLPALVPRVPLAVPAPVELGAPDDAYPFRWSVAPWLPGRAAGDPLAGEPLGFDAVAGAAALGGFVRALRAVDPTGGPVKDGTGRGAPLARLDDDVRAAVAACGDRIDGRATLRAWDRALAAPPSSALGWIHGDLMPGNLLAHGGRLAAVIDWGALGVGDPAADLPPAWWLFDGAARAAFREAACDGLPDADAAWERARGWVLVQAVIALPYYWDRWPAFARASQRRVAAVLADAG
jgi:aminoglycoside phosphotransferase (APT) family kinase protein